MKKLFEFKTSTLVGTALGASVFTVLFMYVKFPTLIPEVSIQTAYGAGGFFAAMFGPIAGFILTFLGHALSDAVQFSEPYWSWIIASGVAGFIIGLVYPQLHVEDGVFSTRDKILFNAVQLVAHVTAWGVVAPLLDVLMYGEPVGLSFIQGISAAVSNTIVTGVIGTALLQLCSKYCASKNIQNN